MRLVLRSALAVVLLLITLFTAVVCWSGYRVTSAMNYGALRAKVIVCIDARQMALRESEKVPQSTVDNVLARQIWAHYYFNPKRKLPHHALLLSSDIGWQTFWSPDERRQIYESLERRMRPCPGALERFREQQSESTRPIDCPRFAIAQKSLYKLAKLESRRLHRAHSNIDL